MTRWWESEEEPQRSVVLYRFFDYHDELLYVGISSSAVSRWRSHNGQAVWWGLAVKVTMYHYETRAEALAAELEAIRTENPMFNVAGKRDARTAESLGQKEEGRP